MSSRLKNRLEMDPEVDLDIWKIFKKMIGIDFYSEYRSRNNTITDDRVLDRVKIIPASKHVILKGLRIHKSSDCIFTRRKEASHKVLIEVYGRNWSELMKDDFNLNDYIYCEEVMRYLTITYNSCKGCVGKWLVMIEEEKEERTGNDRRYIDYEGC